MKSLLMFVGNVKVTFSFIPQFNIQFNRLKVSFEALSNFKIFIERKKSSVDFHH